MFRKILILSLLLSFSFIGFAQSDTGSHLRVSLLTCGPGDEEIYEVFGHTAVRVVDSAQHTDNVYNYGTFEYGPNFEWQFMRGKLLYCISVYPFQSFMQEYVEAHRSVEEQALLLSQNQAQEIKAFLDWNNLPANKYYKYDFFFDNCATRIRDIFPRVFGKGFVFGQTIPANSRLTFRDIINRYFYRDHWTRFGINILLGSRIDSVMTNKDIMFLPDYLRDGVGGAAVNGRKIATPSRLILAGQGNGSAGINGALIFTIILALLTILGLSIKSLQPLGRIMSGLVLLASGLLGVIILCMWFGTDHQTCRDNFNLLWALPTNLILAFSLSKNRSRYAVVGILLICLSLLLHIFKVQHLPIVELGPFLLALLFIYGSVYRNGRVQTTA